MDERLLGAIDAPVAVLGTILPDGRPHLVPVTFAAAGELLVTAVDWKPKSGRKLQRITNVAGPGLHIAAGIEPGADRIVVDRG